jgi:hypothetical protein
MERWVNVIRRYAESITFVSLGDMTAGDLVELPADCMVVDGRAADLTGIGMLTTQASARLLPVLILHGQHWQMDDLHWARTNNATTVCPYAEDDFEHILEDFLRRTEPTNHKEEWEQQPWLRRPRTVTVDQVEAARRGHGRAHW